MNKQYEIIKKLAERTITYFKDELQLSVDDEFEIIEVDSIEYLDISTLISLSNGMSGTIGMSVSNELAYSMVEAFIFGEMDKDELEELSSENVAETLNITLGNILKELDVVKKGKSIDISTPYTMHNSVTITKKKNGTMVLCMLKSNNKVIILSYFI